jgi:hypothetical protein
MSGDLHRRVEALEQAHGGECPRCSGMSAIIVNGEVKQASRHKELITPEEWHEYEAEEDADGRCPVCGRKPVEIRSVGRLRAAPK